MSPSKISYRQLRKAALKYYKVAAQAVKDSVGDDAFENDRTRHRAAFFTTLKKKTHLHRRIEACTTVSVSTQRVADILFSALLMEAKWAKEVADWDDWDTGAIKWNAPPLPVKRIHEKGPISAFVRSYVQKPVEDLALEANWFFKEDAKPDSDDESTGELLSDIDSDTEEKKSEAPVPKLPHVDLARKRRTQEELRVVMACLPDAVLDAVVSYCSEKKLTHLINGLADYSEYVFYKYRARRAIDQSNVLCALSQWRAKDAPIIDFLAHDTLQYIAEFAGATMRTTPTKEGEKAVFKPLPIRMARLTQPHDIHKALADVLSQVASRPRDATRASLKRIFDAIPPPIDKSTAPVPAAALPSKKKARKAKDEDDPTQEDIDALIAAAF